MLIYQRVTIMASRIETMGLRSLSKARALRWVAEVSSGQTCHTKLPKT